MIRRSTSSLWRSAGWTASAVVDPGDNDYGRGAPASSLRIIPSDFAVIANRPERSGEL